jgi:hypothetical protein
VGGGDWDRQLRATAGVAATAAKSSGGSARGCRVCRHYLPALCVCVRVCVCVCECVRMRVYDLSRRIEVATCTVRHSDIDQ